MKRAAIVVVILAAIGFGYQWRHVSSAAKAYEAFAEAILQRRYEAAAEMSADLTADDLKRLGSQERIGAGPPMFQTLFPSRFKIESEQSSGDGTTIVAVQTVLFNPVGVESALRPAMYAELRQVTTLTRRSGTWKVASFTNEFVKMDEMPHP